MTARVIPFLVAALSLAGYANAQIVTISGTGTVEGWRTIANGNVTPGASPALETALPAGEPFTATFRYDPTKVSVSFSANPISTYYRGDPVTACPFRSPVTPYLLTPIPFLRGARC
jgi:hypothetical protein